MKTPVELQLRLEEMRKQVVFWENETRLDLSEDYLDYARRNLMEVKGRVSELLWVLS